MKYLRKKTFDMGRVAGKVIGNPQAIESLKT